jgi:hypothetical protein
MRIYVPPRRLRVPQVEYHCFREHFLLRYVRVHTGILEVGLNMLHMFIQDTFL